METPAITLSKMPETHRRLSTTSQLFTRIDKLNSTNRKLQTSKDPRAIRHEVKNESLDSFKENVCHQRYFKAIKSAIKINENEMASAYLLSLRKQYDKMAKNIKQQSSSINVMKKQIQFIRSKLKNSHELSVGTKQKLDERQNELNKIQSKQAEATMETKILQQIIGRMKQQHLKNKNIWSSIQLIMKEKKKQLKIKQEEILQWDDSIHKLFQKMKKITLEFNKNAQERELKFQDYRNYVNDLEDQQKFQQERKQRTFQLLSMQSNDIMDAKNVVLRDVLMANKVLDKILQSKISDLLNHYQSLQNCYHLVKTETNISDPQALARKFFSYSENLQQVTSKIKFYEEKQQKLIERNKQLKQIEKQKIIKKLEQEKLYASSLSVVQQQKQKLVHECLEKQLAMKKIKVWLCKVNQFIGCKKSQSASVQINEICQAMRQQIEQLKKQNKNVLKFQSPGVRLKKVVKQLSEQQLKIRRSQAEEIRQSNHVQNKYLYQSRRAVKNKFLIKMQPSKQTKF